MEEQVSHISDLEGLNSELEGFLADLHGREESMSARVKALEEELSGARNSAAAAMARLTQKEASLSSAVEQLRAALDNEKARVSTLGLERENLSRQLEVISARLEDAKAAAAEKEDLLKEARAAAKEEAAKSSAAVEALQGSLLNESSRVAVLAAERDGLLRQVEDISARLKEAKAASAEKDEHLKEVKTLAKQDLAKAAADAEELRAALNNENTRASALGTERETLLRQLTVVSDRLEEAKASAAEKENLLKEVRASAKQEAAKAAAAAEELRAALNKESSRASSISLERDDLARRQQALTELLDEAKAALAEKDALMKEARAAAKEKAAELSAVIDQLRSSVEDEAAKVSAMVSERDGLLGRLKESADLLEAEKEISSKKDALLGEARAAAKAKAAELSAAIDQLKASLFEESSKAEAMALERNGLLRQLEDSASQLAVEKEASSKKDALLDETRAAAKARAAELSAAIDQVKASLRDESARIEALVLERDGLLRKLEQEARSLEAEKTRSSERELLINGARSALKDKEGEIERLLRGAEELKADLALERANVKDREAQLQKTFKMTEAVERRLELAAQENTRSEEGYLLKVELVKKELREQAKRTAEVERKLAAAGARLEDALDEVAKKEKMLAEANALLAEKDAQLKDANLQLKALTKEFSEIKSGSGHENIQRAREMAASMAARVEELENAMSEAAARSLEKFRASQAELSGAKTALRVKEEENAGLKARETSLLGELSDAEEKWKLASAQLHNAVSRLRNAENENEIALGRLKSVEEERNKFRAAAIKAETASAAMAAQESRARDGEASGLIAALEEQAATYTALLRKYDDVVLLNEALAREKAGDKAEAASLREALKAAQAAAESESGEKRGVRSDLAEKLRAAEARLKKKEDELEEACAIAKAAGSEAVSLRARLKQMAQSATGESEAESARYIALTEKVHGAEALLKKKEFELAEARAAGRAASDEAASLRARLQETAATAAAAAVEAEAERARYAALSEKMRSADALLKKKETELDEAKSSLKSAQDAAEAATGEKKGLQADLAEKLRGAEALLKKKEFELEQARSAAASAGDEAVLLRAHLQETAAAAAGEAEAERARYAALSEKMHNADALLRKKEFELDEARGALVALDSECSLLRQSRAALGEKYSREIHAENELLKEAQARIVERDSFIARLSITEEELKKEAEALKKEKQNLLSLVRKKSAAPAHSAKVSEAERMLAEKESRLVKLRAELENTRAEKAELQGREKELREELKARPYRAMLREAEENLLIKEKMLAEVTSRMKKIGRDFDDLKVRGQASGAPGYIPDFEELVAGVAHQVANSISIIRSHAEFCAETPEAEGAKESLNVIVRNIVNLQKKIDIIMNFSKPVIPQRSPEKLTTVLSEVLDGLRSSGRLENIKVSLKGGEKLGPVSLDRVRFASAVEQLLINAVEAMPGGGELSVSLSGGGGRQRLEIADTGAGVEKKNLGAVFHPFFTTRPGKMGLGLTLARNVARAHGGTLELLNDPGRGARAVLELPEA